MKKFIFFDEFYEFRVMVLNIIIAIAFVSKVFLHKYTAQKNGIDLVLSGYGGASFELIWFYNKPVSVETSRLKRTVNILFGVFLVCCTIKILMS